MELFKKKKKIAFAIGTGRCGTHFIYELLKKEPYVASCHERNPLNETFHRYCKWYKLPVDDEGFLSQKELEIKNDLRNFEISFESSAYLSFAVVELHERFNAKFILMIRHPIRVINSYLKKGWYENEIVYKDPNLALGYQAHKLFHHFLGRTVPTGNYFQQWNKLSRVGKLAWYWKILNSAVLDQFNRLPKENWMIQKLEEFDFNSYKKIADFLSIKTKISKDEFEKINNQKPAAMKNKPSFNDWTSDEVDEYRFQISECISMFNYNIMC